jgi:hypothetical protein
MRGRKKIHQIYLVRMLPGPFNPFFPTYSNACVVESNPVGAAAFHQARGLNINSGRF